MRFMFGLIVFHRRFTLGVFSVNVLVYCWFMFGICWVCFALYAIGFNFWLVFWLILCLCSVYAWCMFGVRLVYVGFMFGFNVVHGWFVVGLFGVYVWLKVGYVGRYVRFVFGLMLFHLWFTLGRCPANVLVYWWFMLGLFLVYFGLDWIGPNVWFTGLAQLGLGQF